MKSDLLIIAGGRVAAALLGLIAIRVVTTFLSPEEYGQLSVLIVVQTFCGLFLVNPVGQYINRHTHEWWNDGTLFSRLLGYRKYIIAVSLIGGFVSFFVFKGIASLQTALAMLAMVVMINGCTWNATYIPLLNMVGQRGAAVSWGLITSVISLVASVLLYFIWPSSVMWFVGQAVGFCIGALGASMALRHGVLPKQSKSPLELIGKQSIITYCLPLAIATGFMWVQLSGYRLIVEYYWGLSLLGFFAVGLSLAGQIWGLTETLAQQFLYPLFYKRIALSDKQPLNETIFSEALSDLLNVLVPIYLVLIGLTFVSAPYLLKILVASQYAGAEVYMRLGIILEFCRVVANLLSNAAQATKKTQSVILPYGLGALVVVLMLVVVGERHLSISWAAICLATAALIMLSAMWRLMLGEVKFYPDFKRWIMAILIMLILMMSAWWLPSHPSLTIAIVILAVVTLLSTILLFLFSKNNRALQRLVTINLS